MSVTIKISLYTQSYKRQLYFNKSNTFEFLDTGKAIKFDKLWTQNGNAGREASPNLFWTPAQ